MRHTEMRQQEPVDRVDRRPRGPRTRVRDVVHHRDLQSDLLPCVDSLSWLGPWAGAVAPAVASLTAPNGCLVLSLPWSTFPPHTTHWAFQVARIPSFAAQAKVSMLTGLRLRDNQAELFSLKSSLLSLRSFLELSSDSSRVGSALVAASGKQQTLMAAQTIRFLLW